MPQPRAPGQPAPLPVVVAAANPRHSVPVPAGSRAGKDKDKGKGKGAKEGKEDAAGAAAAAAQSDVRGGSEDGGDAARHRPIAGQRIVVMVADNAATNAAVQLALSLLRPGKDLLYLVTVVQVGEGLVWESVGWMCVNYHAFDVWVR